LKRVCKLDITSINQFHREKQRARHRLLDRRWPVRTERRPGAESRCAVATCMRCQREKIGTFWAKCTGKEGTAAA
jgi:hypothetical protein